MCRFSSLVSRHRLIWSAMSRNPLLSFDKKDLESSNIQQDPSHHPLSCSFHPFFPRRLCLACHSASPPFPSFLLLLQAMPPRAKRTKEMAIVTCGLRECGSAIAQEDGRVEISALARGALRERSQNRSCPLTRSLSKTVAELRNVYYDF